MSGVANGHQSHSCLRCFHGIWRGQYRGFNENPAVTRIWEPAIYRIHLNPQAMPNETLIMSQGTVKWFNEKKGFGFILDPAVASDIFVHFSAIQSDGFKTLQEGDRVEYELYTDEKGAKARNVVRVAT